ncbi:hypothetical protein FIBSPDRAFT_769321 [Athelia psychrophila]|uniref:Uncharacterized protein n=1 Tax=Athelia psychrophila TaxID=1759441 RepID=A0A167TQI8_9AGAM|nr:hypothetical protein FIBSPDRAFT_769321 [Fibularhizoctonia sp. CBS 109695]
MGWRAAGWKATPPDYSGYRLNLRDWMTTSRARAALMCGGIVWRLCLDVLVPEDIAEVLIGPDYTGHGQCVRFDGDTGQSWDNELTPDDMFVISGVYKMFTGNGEQTADLSWWPKQSTWLGSSMDTGYWAPECEEWYQKRRALIRSGDPRGDPKTAENWRQALQMWRPRKIFVNRIQVESAGVFNDGTRGH